MSGAVRDCCSGLGADGSDCFVHSNLKPSIGLSCSPPMFLLQLQPGHSDPDAPLGSVVATLKLEICCLCLGVSTNYLLPDLRGEK